MCLEYPASEETGVKWGQEALVSCHEDKCKVTNGILMARPFCLGGKVCLGLRTPTHLSLCLDVPPQLLSYHRDISGTQTTMSIKTNKLSWATAWSEELTLGFFFSSPLCSVRGKTFLNARGVFQIRQKCSQRHACVLTQASLARIMLSPVTFICDWECERQEGREFYWFCSLIYLFLIGVQ